MKRRRFRPITYAATLLLLLASTPPAVATTCDLPGLAGEEILLSTPPWPAGAAAIAWTGTGYGVVYWDENWFTVFRRLDIDGQPLGAPVPVQWFDGEKPEIVWAGSAYAVVQAPGSGGIYFSLLDESGTSTTQTVVTGARTTMLLDIVWTGSEFGVAWASYPPSHGGEIYFTRVDSSGAKIGSDVQVTSAEGSSGQVSLVWTGTEYGLAWQDERDRNWEIYFCRLDGSGTKIGGDVRVTVDAAQSRASSLVWTGTEYGLAWQDDRNGDWEVYFTRVSSSGTKIGGDVQVAGATSEGPALAWNGDEYGLAWEYEPAAVRQIHFARLDATGNKIGAELLVSDAGEQSDAALVWTGTEYAVVWQTTDDDVYFRRIGCNCVDADDDGVNSCNDCDDANPNCTSDCTDDDGDGFCVTTDCDDAFAECTTECIDVDEDGLPVCGGDCDDGNPNCTTDCTDGDEDAFCVTHDCDDSSPGCTTDCTDADEDGLAACEGDCDDENGQCTTDCTDADSDGYCVTTDCDEDNAHCATDCTDADEDGYCVTNDCDDSRSYCTVDCTDVDSDEYCVDWDCDDDNAQCTTDCTDADYDGYCVTTDCNDGNEFCSTDCTDLDEDEYCVTDDCDDTLPYCATDCTDMDEDGYCVGVDCDDALPEVHACDRACAVPGRLGGETYVGVGAFPSLVKKGQGSFGLAWQSDTAVSNNLYLVEISGASVGSVTELTNYSQCLGANKGPSLVWNDSWLWPWGIAYFFKRCEGVDDLLFTRVNDYGEQDWGATIHEGPNHHLNSPSMVWTGTHYGVAWEHGWTPTCGYMPVAFVRLDEDGDKIGTEVTVSDSIESAHGPSLVWTGSEFGVAWEDWRAEIPDVYFARIGTNGAKIGNDVSVSDIGYLERHPSLVWDGTGYGIAWHDNRDGDTQVYFARLDATGNKIGGDLPITTTPNSSAGVSMVWTGEEYGLCWSDGRNGGSDIYFASVDAAGNKLDRDLRVSYLTNASGQCDIVWEGSAYGVVWRGDGDIYFTRVGCNCPDGDGDGASVCMDCDDTRVECMLDCSDGDGDGLAVCQGDCDNTNANCLLDCSDGDGDGVALCYPDCDDANPYCGIDCTDADSDAFCAAYDCDDANPSCSLDCTDADDDKVCLTPECNPGEVCDNCPLDYNPVQSDWDVDDEGDVCDVDDGMIYVMFEGKDRVGWQEELGFDSWNAYQGDLEVLRSGGDYTQALGSNDLADRSCAMASPLWEGIGSPDPGQVAFFLTTGMAGAVESSLGDDGTGAERQNANPCP